MEQRVGCVTIVQMGVVHTVSKLVIAVPVGDVLSLIAHHTQKDNVKFEETAMKIAKEIEPQDVDGQLALWIFAQFGHGAWVPQGGDDE